MPEASLGFEGTSSDLEKMKSYMCTRRTSSAMPMKPHLDLCDSTNVELHSRPL